MNRDSVDIAILRDATNRIFDFIQHELGMDRVALGRDFYWVVPDNELHQMEHKPNDLEVGSLVDDIEFVVSAAADKEPGIPLTLMHIAPILKALSTTVPSYKPPTKISS